MSKLLITGGTVIDPASRTNKAADVAIVDGIVAEIGKKLTRTPLGPDDRVIDATGCIVSPGLIDPHVHLREPGGERAETIASGTGAGVAGGFTTLCCMPNTTPAIDNDVLVHFVLSRARETGACRVFPVAAVSKGRRGEELAELGLMARAGAVGFSDDGDCIASAALMNRALASVKATGRVLMQHCQEPTLARPGPGGAVMHAGEVSTRLELSGWPRSAEELIIERDVRLNRAHGCAYHAQHISSGGSIEIIRRARKEGQPVTGEASPHHLLLTCDLIETSGYDTRYKMNPPLREKSDIKLIKEGIADGTITILATDHAPHPAETKETPFDTASFGIVGLETALALYAQALIDDDVLTWPQMLAMLTINPAKLCGLDRSHGLGSLRKGGPADVTIIDPNEKWTIATSTFVGQSKNSPFIGRAVKSRVVATIVAGQVKFARR
jgi:dihydroorotase